MKTLFKILTLMLFLRVYFLNENGTEVNGIVFGNDNWHEFVIMDNGDIKLLKLENIRKAEWVDEKDIKTKKLRK